jgi:DNA polymerase-4
MNLDYERQILHIDMNSFFASCEQAVNPELKKAPLIVGGDPEKRSGIVLAASYDAKRYGVKTTMTLNEAARLCPGAVFVKPTHGLYEKMSRQVMQIFSEYAPAMEQLSIDEAFLDMTGTQSLYGDIMQVAKVIQNRILEELKLPCSVGISSNKLLAKMASDYKKPMGITTIYPHEVEEKIWPLKVSELFGVGKKSAIKLNQSGIQTIGQLAKTDILILNGLFGESMANMLHNYANGIDPSPVEPVKEDSKSVGNEMTFPEDLTKTEDILRELLILSDKVAYRLRQKKLKGKTISIKVKYYDFSVITRAHTIDTVTDSADCIYNAVKELIKTNKLTKAIRLLGVTVTNFEDENNQQLSLFTQDNNTSKLDSMLDEIREKYGYSAVKRATNLKNPFNNHANE